MREASGHEVVAPRAPLPPEYQASGSDSRIRNPTAFRENASPRFAVIHLTSSRRFAGALDYSRVGAPKNVPAAIRQLDSAIRAVKRREQRFRDFAETAADWFWETDSHIRVKFLSNRFRAVSGTAPGRLIGRPALEALQSLIDDPESLNQVRNALTNQRSLNDVKLSWRNDSGSAPAVGARSDSPIAAGVAAPGGRR